MSYRLDKSFQELAQLKLADMFRSDIRLLGFYSLSRKKNIMKERIERARKHFRDNRAVYISSAVCLTVGVAGTLVLRDSNSQALIKQGLNWKPRAEINTTVINLVERSTPSRPVHLVGTNLYFSSIGEAARETGHHFSMISKNVNGHIPNVKGDVFQLMEIAN